MLLYKYRFEQIGLLFHLENDVIVKIEFITDSSATQPSGSDICNAIQTQFDEYFGGKRSKFTLPIKLLGTEFQIKVWTAMLDIGYGQTVSYKEIAQRIGNEKAARAVGMANNKNPLPIIVPCHRVIGSNGTLTGFAGGLGLKSYLIELERKSLS